MPRAKFQTLTEQMFYILLSLVTECCGVDVMERVEKMTEQHTEKICWTIFQLN